MIRFTHHGVATLGFQYTRKASVTGPEVDQLAAMARGHCLNAEMAKLRRMYANYERAVWRRYALNARNMAYRGYRRHADYVERTFDVVVDFGKLGSPLA